MFCRPCKFNYERGKAIVDTQEIKLIKTSHQQVRQSQKSHEMMLQTYRKTSNKTKTSWVVSKNFTIYYQQRKNRSPNNQQNITTELQKAKGPYNPLMEA